MSICPIEEAAKESPNQTAWISPSQKISFTQLHRDVISKMDLLHKERVAIGSISCIIGQDPYTTVCALFAAWRLGSSVALFNPQLPSQAIQSLVVQTQKKSIVRSLLLATSGSTAEPKIAILSATSLLANARASIALTPSDRWLLSLPLHHVSGIGIILRCILAKAAIVTDTTHKDITHLSAVPTQLYRASPVYPHLKCVLLGGAPLLSEPTPRLPIYRTYGLTEMGSMVLAQKETLDTEYLGHPLPNREMRLADDGEIWVRGLTRFDGYLNCPPLAKDAWFPTKDIGRFDVKKGFAILGRKDLQFISGGENIQPEEIEKALLQIPGVLEAIVIPQKNPEYGSIPIALVQSLQKDLSLSQITSHLSSIFPKYKIPKTVHLVNEFPKTGNKIDRKKIIATYL